MCPQEAADGGVTKLVVFPRVIRDKWCVVSMSTAESENMHPLQVTDLHLDFDSVNTGNNHKLT